ncbi:ATP-binding protein [Saccharopolyspora shandongensis]|uniref:ATP-binding protein n=1 Tax=Saccharopolyspora shandongensis TaxID=418495 RepID=UPI0033FAFBFE
MASDENPAPKMPASSNEMTALVGGHVIQAGTISGGINLGGSDRLAALPRQLPAAPRLFTGRVRELVQLTDILRAHADDSTVMITAISGSGGIGKSYLAIHWAHQHADRFPDGQLYVNLRGFDPSGAPVHPSSAVRAFLEAFGVAPSNLPADPEAQVALYRTLMAGRRMLVVLDNARDADQVLPLIPGSSGCAVLVTSRYQLAGLVAVYGAHPLSVDVLSESDSHDLLVGHLGRERVDRHPEAVSNLLDHCGGLPLALGIVAARISLQPDIPLDVLSGELREESSRLDALDAGGPGVDLRAVFSWSAQALSQPQSRVFQLLGLAPGADLSSVAAASLIGLPIRRTLGLLRDLERANLVHASASGRYRMHDLVKLYAAEEAGELEAGAEWDLALKRLVDFYLHTAYDSSRKLYSRTRELVLEPPERGSLPLTAADSSEAAEWLATEHGNLLIAVRKSVDHGWYVRAWNLVESLDTYHRRRAYIHENLINWRSALVAAEQLGDAGKTVLAQRNLGDAYSRAGRHDDAVHHLQHALTASEASGDERGAAHTHQVFALAWESHGENGPALEHAQRALEIYRRLADPTRTATSLSQVGWFSAQLGRYEEARDRCAEALALHRSSGYREGEAHALDGLGYVAHNTGDHLAAIDYYRAAIEVFRALGNEYWEPSALDRLAEAHVALGRRAQARELWRQALELYRSQLRMIDVAKVQEKLSALDDG